jgi:prepilin peptidase CpaA
MNALLRDALPLAVLALLLAAATRSDIRTRRIPNRLVLWGALAGLSLHSIWPEGSGITGAILAGKGPWFSIAGFALGLVLLLPFYALRTMGAGDVKLVAMTGAFLGPAGVAGAALLTMLCGGLLALLVASLNGQLGAVLRNVRDMVLSMVLRMGLRSNFSADPAPAATGKLAYAIAIACGTGAQIVLAGTPVWRFFS